MSDLAYSYTFTLKRLKADGTHDAIDSEVFHSKRRLVNGDFELTIDKSEIGGPGRCVPPLLRYQALGFGMNRTLQN